VYGRVYLLRNRNIFKRGSYEVHVLCSLLITMPPCTNTHVLRNRLLFHNVEVLPLALPSNQMKTRRQVFRHSIPGFWVSANIPTICFQISRPCWRPSTTPRGKEKWHGQSLNIRREGERNTYSVKSYKHYRLYLHRLDCCTFI